MTDSERLLELRRRVQADPASIAFAQLAEECRRAGATDEAVAICKAGLQYHPGYVSARVTQGRALTELGRLDEAEVELRAVLESAPDNLTANRALAEVLQKRGQLPAALDQYRRTLELAKYDPEIEDEVHRIETVVAPPVPTPPAPAAEKVAVADLFDFDTLLEQLGGRTQRSLEFDFLEPPLVTPAPSVLESVELHEDDADPFSMLERQLRENDVQREAEQREMRILSELEEWLAALAVDRDVRPNA